MKKPMTRIGQPDPEDLHVSFHRLPCTHYLVTHLTGYFLSFRLAFCNLSPPPLKLSILIGKITILQAYQKVSWATIDVFTLVVVGSSCKMSNSYTDDHGEATVAGFEVPKSPDSSYNNTYPGNDDETRDPPMVPPHLQQTLLNYPASSDTSGTVPLPQNVILNHLYIENSESPRSVVALGFTHRFRTKYVTVVLYKPVQRRGNTSI
ncbi:SNF1-related protein kinase regulatory subunit beta-3 [Senna tora]|uniref:SNF1-related protein kinase regulatory subunit beta-3 n=1 Tax=Senna tora TaxID=362788 RepID=A0A834TLY6_9FABA|nr:SNF1-related protein kinase regulatory subunit beta-3 [Senna tora]